MQKNLKRFVRSLFRVNFSPDFLIIGAQKAGTSSLFYYLNKHPFCVGSSQKELHYFSCDSKYNLGRRWYASQFPLSLKDTLKTKLYFEATPSYLYLPFCASRIRSCNSNIKLLVILRDPVKRAFSSWNMFKDLYENHSEKTINRFIRYANDESRIPLIEILQGKSFPEFKDIIGQEMFMIENNIEYTEPSFLKKGIYYDQLKRYFDFFDKTNLMIIQDIDLRDSRIETLEKITQFLRIPQMDWDSVVLDKRHIGIYKSEIPYDTEAKMREFYKQYDQKLEKLINTKMYWT